jgi:serine/threonine protein kinase
LESPDDDSIAAKQRLVEPITLVLLPENNHPLDQRAFQPNDCQPILNVSIHPTCNSLHELDFVGSGDDADTSSMIPISLLSMSGTWRSVWRVEDPLSVPVVLKVLLMKRNYTQESFGMHAIDAQTMEQLTASPHVVDIYTFCGQSQISEFGNNARLSIKDPSLHSITRLRMARDLARGLADLHAYRPIHNYQRTSRSYPAVFAHHDINLANLVRTNRTKNGVSSNRNSNDQNVQIKWNDFNLGVPLRQNRNGTVCPILVPYVSPLWRSPEEIKDTTTTTGGGGVHGAQADVYSFGSLLFLLVARHQPWTHLETEKLSIETIMQKKMAGEMPNLPRKYIEKMEAKILWEAIQACYRLDPQKRPTAYELAQAIGTAYNWSRNKKKKPIIMESVRALFKKTKTKKVSE